MRRSVVAGALLASLALVGAGGAAVAASRAGEALPGTTVAGVDVAGLDRARIAAAVERPARDRTTGTLEVVVGDERRPVDRDDVTGTVDLDGTAERAVQAGRTGYPLAGLLGPVLARGERDVELEVPVDDRALDQTVATLADELDREPSPGGFTVEGTTVTAQPPVTGRVLDRQAAREELEQALLDGRQEPLELPAEEEQPPTTEEDVQRVTSQAQRALAAPYALTAGDVSLEVQPAQVAPVLSSELVDGELQLRVDLPALNGLVAGLSSEIAQPARSARIEAPATGPRFDAQGTTSWRPRPAQVTVRPGQEGRDVDVDAATARLAELVLAGERTTELPVRTTQPAVTTAAAERVSSVIGTFTTYYAAGQPRARNIARAAELADRTVVVPGGTFSLSRAVGPRTAARGFVEDSVIIDGQLEDAVGGGVSQVATTFMNAAFFAGLPILEHRPHSFYISRYPAGRESTIASGAIDVRFRNDTDSAILVRSTTTASSVTVTLYGDNGGRLVRAVHGPRQPRADGGFSITVTREVSGGDGRGGRRVFRTSYDPPPPPQDED